MLKKLYHGTIRPLLFGYEDNSRGEMQNILLEKWVGGLMWNPVELFKQAGTSIAQTADNRRTEKLNAAQQHYGIREITEKEFRRYLMQKNRENAPQYINSFYMPPAVRVERTGVGLDNSPLYMAFPLRGEEEKEFWKKELLTRRVSGNETYYGVNKLYIPPSDRSEFSMTCCRK